MTQRNSNYDKHPRLRVDTSSSETWVDWRAISDRLKPLTIKNPSLLCVECYPGAFERSIRQALEQGLRPAEVIYTPELFKASKEIDQMLESVLGDDPVFGRMNEITLDKFFDQSKLLRAREKAAAWRDGLLLVVGVGAALVSANPDLLVYADMARWEIQKRQRRNQIANLASENFNEVPSLKYKRAFFVDWRAADRLKKELLSRIDFFLDTNGATPKLSLIHI